MEGGDEGTSSKAAASWLPGGVHQAQVAGRGAASPEVVPAAGGL